MENQTTSETKALPEHDREMGLFDHLRELRKRLLISSIAILLTTVVAFGYSQELFFLLKKPYADAFGDNLLIGTGPAEAFILRLKVALFAGLILSAPVIFYQLWLFVAPGLYQTEKRLVLPFVFFSTALFLLGVWFCYYAVFPFAFSFFFDEYKTVGITPTIRMSEHLSMMVQGLLGFGVVFEMPILAYFLGRAGIIDHHTLVKGTRYAIVIIFIVAAVLTPPDALTQLIMAVPLMLLYGISILVVKYTAQKRAD